MLSPSEQAWQAAPAPPYVVPMPMPGRPGLGTPPRRGSKVEELATCRVIPRTWASCGGLVTARSPAF